MRLDWNYGLNKLGNGFSPDIKVQALHLEKQSSRRYMVSFWLFV